MDRMAKYIPLNFQMMLEPVNWIILFLMVAIAGLAVSLISSSNSAAAE